MEEQVVETTVTPSSKMNLVDSWLDEYEAKIGLPAYTENAVSKNIGRYLSMTEDQLERLTPEQCAEMSIVLVQTSFHIQRAQNRELAHVTWADDVLRLGVAGKTTQYSGSFFQQESSAIKGDDYLFKVSRIRTHAKQRVDRLSFLSNSLNKMADKLENLQVAKNRKA